MPSLRPLLPWLASLTLCTGCGAQDLAQSWQLDRLRILGVAAEPAEPQPGDTVTFSSLVYLPYGEELSGVVWFACAPESADDFGCSLDPSVTEAFSGDLDSLTPEEQAALFQQAVEAGLIGFEPLFAPTWPVPEDALDGLTDAEKVEGLSAFINVTALPEDAESDADVELAYKRVPVSLNPSPNQNPAFNQLLFQDDQGNAIEAIDGVFPIEQGASYTIRPLLEEGAVEDYVFITSEGVEEARTEEPYVTWYTEGGSFDQPFSLHPYLDVEWTAPKKGFEGVVVAVIRDRRGGMAWASLTVSTSAATE